MKFVSLQENDAVLQFSLDELLMVSNALNEVCNGIDVPEFDTRLGGAIDDVRLLLASIGAAIDKFPT